MQGAALKQGEYLPGTRPMPQTSALPLDPGLRGVVEVHFTAHLSRTAIWQILFRNLKVNYRKLHMCLHCM